MFTWQDKEGMDDVLARWELVKYRSGNAGNLTMSEAGWSWILLSVLRIPAHKWDIILQPTRGALPSNVQEYQEMIAYLRRTGHQNDHRGNGGDSMKNVRQPFFVGMQAVTDGDPGVYFDNNGQEEPWPSQSVRGQEHYKDDDDEYGSEDSTEEGDYEDHQAFLIDFPELNDMSYNQAGEEIYLEYRHARRRFKRFTGNRRKGKGKGKGKSGGKNRFRKGTAIAPHVHFSDGTFFGGKGKGHSSSRTNPIGRDGKIMTCSLCGSESHFRAKCTKSGNKGKGQGKGGKHLSTKPTMFAGEWNQTEAPLGKPQTAFFNTVLEEDNPAPSWSPRLPGQSFISFADGSDSMVLNPILPVRVGYFETYDDQTGPGSHHIAAAYHSQARLVKGERLLIDTGAVDNIAGSAWMERVEQHGKKSNHDSN